MMRRMIQNCCGSTLHRDEIQLSIGLAEQQSKTTGRKLSKSTIYAMLAHLKRFFHWLAGQPGYKSRIRYSDADYFNLSDKDSRIATARRENIYADDEVIEFVARDQAKNVT